MAFIHKMPQADRDVPPSVYQYPIYTTNHLQPIQRTSHRDGDTCEEFHTLSGYDNLWGSRDDMQVRVTSEPEGVQITATFHPAPVRTVLKMDCPRIRLFRPSPSVL